MKNSRFFNTIAVVDDEPGMREMLRMMLERKGYKTLEAENGRAGFELFRQGQADLILLDVKMPELDGIGLLQKIHEAAQLSKKGQGAPPIILMSAFGDLDTAVRGLKLGANDYISKPFKSDEILLKIRLAEEKAKLKSERDALKKENQRLKSEDRVDSSTIVGNSKSLQQVLALVAKVADYKSTVLILGESGTGKELLARQVHDLSSRREKPFVAINCGAIPEPLLESELFGHVKGAFTDANRDKKGLIQEADGGTLFLDEIGELPIALQVKLLRFLQEDEIRPVGSNTDQKVDVRVVAATSRDLHTMVDARNFREDLYYRLNVFQLEIPALRERSEDVPALVEHFIKQQCHRLGREPIGVSKQALRLMLGYEWPGNIRELENVVERALVLADDEQIEVEHLPPTLHPVNTLESQGLEHLAEARIDAKSMPEQRAPGELSIKKATRQLEQALIRKSLKRTGGNKTRAAELLEISPRALLYKIKEYKITS